MKKTVMNRAILVAIAALTFSPLASAHHPLSVLDDYIEQLDGLFERIDENISDMHNEIVGDVEDYEFMGNLTLSSGAEPTPTATMGDANQESAETAMSGESPASMVNLTGVSNQGFSNPAMIPRPGSVPTTTRSGR